MSPADKPAFLEMVKAVHGAYGKPLPDAGLLKAWWAELESFPLRIVGAALQAYKDENGEFAPVPAGIAKRCKLMDGRPGPEEAWALALTSRDQEDTIVWTQECAEAYALASPIMALGDEVGARMAFKEAYVRMVTEARAATRPAVWQVSVGWDKNRCRDVITNAQKAGLLPAPQAAALLPYVPREKPEGMVGNEAVEKIKQMLAESAAKQEQQRLAAEEAERIAQLEWAGKANQSIDEYRRNNPHAPLKSAGILIYKEDIES